MAPIDTDLYRPLFGRRNTMPGDVLAETTSIFEQPWWLEAVAPGRWGATTVEKGDEVVARLTYVQDTRFGLRLLRKAPLTPTYGPYLHITAKKPAKRGSQEVRLIEDLLGSLPPFDVHDLKLSPAVQNWLPFHWKGYRQTTGYTYRLNDLSDPEAIWNGMRDNIRRDIRKAERQVTVRTDLGVDRFLDLNDMTFGRRGMRRPYSRDLVRRLDGACAPRDARRMFFAEDETGNVHAALYLVHDERTCYYLMGGGDPEARNSGATSLLMWSAIQYAAKVSKRFDFEGSMLRPVERFFRAFGAEQTPYHDLRSESRRFHVLRTWKDALTPWR